MLYIHIYT